MMSYTLSLLFKIPKNMLEKKLCDCEVTLSNLHSCLIFKHTYKGNYL